MEFWNLMAKNIAFQKLNNESEMLKEKKYMEKNNMIRDVMEELITTIEKELNQSSSTI